MKKLSLVIAIVLLAQLFVPIGHAVAPAPLDSASEWAKSGIASAIAKGFVPTDIQGRYTGVITRQEFCRMAVKWVEYATGQSIDAVLSGRGLTRNTNAFSDTSNPDILAAFALGITNGTGNGQFTPNGQFNRQQAATMIRNACKAVGAYVDGSPDARFSDGYAAADWAIPGINFVRANGIMEGTGENNFSPLATYTREQSIITFNNISLDLFASEAARVTVIVDGMTVDFEGASVLMDDNNRLQAPADKIGAALGAYVEWNASQEITFARGSQLFPGEKMVWVYFHPEIRRYYRSSGGSTESHPMNTEIMVVGSRPYVPIVYLAEALDATVTSENRGGELIVTVTSNRSKQAGDFAIPYSFAESVNYGGDSPNGIKRVNFAMTLRTIKAIAPFSSRVNHLYFILSQQLGAETIDKLKEFVATYEKADIDYYIYETFLDPKTGRYISMCFTWEGGFIVAVYDVGVEPPPG